MILARKVRIIPNKEQEQQLWKSVGTARFIYNWTLARQEENYTLKGTSKNGGKFISDNDLRKELTILKKTEEYKWLNEVSNNVAKQAVKDACNIRDSLKVNQKSLNSRVEGKASHHFITTI
jgi:putative transposase